MIKVSIGRVKIKLIVYHNSPLVKKHQTVLIYETN